MLTYLYLQETDVRHQVEQLKRQRAECIQKIAHLKQQIVEIETQENEAIREVGFFLMDSFWTIWWTLIDGWGAGCILGRPKNTQAPGCTHNVTSGNGMVLYTFIQHELLHNVIW